jgi:hypothetical protein
MYTDPSDGKVYTNGVVTFDPGTNTTTDSGGGGGGGSYSGGGSSGGGGLDYSDPNVGSAVKDEFIFWWGEDWVKSHMSVIASAVEKKRTTDDIRRYSVENGANGPGATQVWDSVRAVVGFDVPAAFVRNIISNGTYLQSGWDQMWGQDTPAAAILGNPRMGDIMDLWNDYTGSAPFGPTAQNYLINLVKQYGWDQAVGLFKQWLPTTHSANSGNYGAEKRNTLRGILQTILRRDPTEEELSQDGPYWDLLTGDMGSLNSAALLEQVRQSGEDQEMYQYKPAYMSEQDWWDAKNAFDNVGNWYYNKTPGEGGFEFTDQEIATMLTEGWTPSSLTNYFTALENAIYSRDMYNPILEEVSGAGWTDDQWFAFANGGEGSGALRAQLVQAQNQAQFREAYRQIMGTDPTPADYEYLSANFVSPSEYLREEQAKVTAAEMYPEVSELLQRVYGTNVTEQQLVDMSIGRAGTGELRAMIREAEKLDQYTWIHKQQYGTDPTPQDYAKYAGYTGPEELTWEITTRERMAELGPDIQEAWTFQYGAPMSEDDLRTMLGEQEGYGELRYKYKEAQEALGKEEAAWDWSMQAPSANIYYAPSEQGGFRNSMVGVADLN